MGAGRLLAEAPVSGERKNSLIAAFTSDGCGDEPAAAPVILAPLSMVVSVTAAANASSPLRPHCGTGSLIRVRPARRSDRAPSALGPIPASRRRTGFWPHGNDR